MRETAAMVSLGCLMAVFVAKAGVEWKNGDWQSSKDGVTEMK